jgi:hypothetical protein
MGDGVLAIWSDRTPGREAELEHWYQTEHLFERLAVPGFRRGRRLQALRGSPGFLTVYDVAAPEVLTSGPYRARLADPTPATRQIMDGGFPNVVRTTCRRETLAGSISGGLLVTARFDVPVDLDALRAAARDWWDPVALATIELWAAIPDAAPGAEERIRGGDRKITACLAVETLWEEVAEAIAARAGEAFPVAQIGVHRLLCTLTNEELRP